MKRFTAVIVDDEPLARQGIRMLVEQDPEIKVVADCSDGVDAIAQIPSLRPDIIFLDIEMPEADGFDVLAALPEGYTPVIIFVTAYNQYAVDAFQVHAIDYVLKPVDPQRFFQTLVRSKEMLNLQNLSRDHERLLTALEDIKQRQGGLDRIPVKTHGRLNLIRTGDIDWIEAADDYVYIHVHGQRLLLRRTLSSLEKALDQNLFVRVHRSTIVNIHRIKYVRLLPHGDAQLELLDTTEIDVSRSYRTRLDELVHRRV